MKLDGITGWLGVFFSGEHLCHTKTWQLTTASFINFLVQYSSQHAFAVENKSHNHECAFAAVCQMHLQSVGITILAFSGDNTQMHHHYRLCISRLSRIDSHDYYRLKSFGTPFLLSFPLMKNKFQLKQMEWCQIKAWMYCCVKMNQAHIVRHV